MIELEEGNGFDGVSGKVDGRPFIVLKKDRPIVRKRLTALHEFVHQSVSLKHGLSKTAVEKLCHTFGGAL
ncbi:MAG: hypothetical protein A2Z99_03205 [Treponema sp. GWB1_62_6]|nr:MAG: hypothetical protein A2001_14065 [Treponema sp. GWC1_61_84]OHE67819.1 MAG: hypothetical protein A2Z99_03205 [Treponema sp. GWB1_62_6]